MSDAVLDCRGLVCPQPVIRAREAIAQNPGHISVLVDNTASLENVSRFLEKSGYMVTAEQKEDSLWSVNGILSGEVCHEESLPDIPEEEHKRILVFLASDVIGGGSDELGTKLMGNFLATLPELGSNLWRIVMLNDGVKLASCPGPALDALKKLEKAGVSILVCGTCLDYYHLLDQKQVGDTTNMLDIVTSLDLADKVIRP